MEDIVSKTVLEQYEERYRLAPLTPDVIIACVGAAEQILLSDVLPTDLVDERELLWLHDRLQAVYTALENPSVPVVSRCAWCFCAGPQTDEAWAALPKMTLDDAGIHAQVCEHNPLVQEVRRLSALLEDIRGRALGVDDGMRDALRALLKSEMTAGELRRALGELVR
jgi:hypothetical protein